MQQLSQSKKITLGLMTLFFLVVIGIILFTIKNQQDIRQHAAGETWTEIGTHPQAENLNSTYAPKNIYTLIPWQGKLYAGYGDYQDNRGPIAINAFDPILKTFNVKTIFDTDAVYRYRQIQGNLMAPSIDPIGAPIPLAVQLEDDTWIQPESLYTTHTYDVGTFNNADLWLVGSLNYDAVAWRSIDGGISWQQAINQHLGTANTVNRFYHIAIVNNKLYIQNNQSASSKVFDGTIWVDGPNITSFGTRQTYFLSKAVYFTGESSGQMRVFDGISTTTPVSGTFYSTAVYGNYLYALSANDIKRTNDLVTWTPYVTSLPANARRIAITNGKLYISANAKIYEYSVPISTLPSVRIKATQKNILESGGVGAITIDRTNDTTQPLSVDFDILGTATNGTDYQTIPTTVTIPAGSSSTTVSIQAITDVATEGNETVLLRLKSTTAYNADLPSEALVTLYEKPPVSIKATNSTIAENAGNATFTITRGGNISQPLSVALNISGSGTNSTDYQTIPTSITIPAGSQSTTVTLTPTNDLEEEENETVKVSLVKTTNYTVILPFQIETTIIDDDNSSSPNIILNPSFEQLDPGGKPLNWSIAATSVDKTTAHSGQNSIKISGPTAYSYFNQAFNPLPSKTYILSAWIKTQDVFGRGGGFRYVQTANSSTIKESPWLRSTNDWTHITLKTPVSADFTAGRLDLWSALNTNETVWFDDVRMAEEGVGTPSITPTLTSTPTPTNTPTPTINITPSLSPTPMSTTMPITNTPQPIGGTTPTAQGTKFALTLLLHAIGNGGDNKAPGSPGNFNPQNTQRSILITVFDSNGSQVTSKQGLIDFNLSLGNFTTTISLDTLLPIGSYTIKIKSPRYLQKQISGFLTITPTNQTDTINLPITTLIVGDSNNDNAINVLDYNIVSDCFSILLPPKACTDQSKKTSADLNDDGKIDGTDLNLFIRNVNSQSGD